MPLYEYVCINCGTAFEQFVRSASSQEAVTCPKCASMLVNKQFSTFGTKGAGGFSGGTRPAMRPAPRVVAEGSATANRVLADNKEERLRKLEPLFFIGFRTSSQEPQ